MARAPRQQSLGQKTPLSAVDRWGLALSVWRLRRCLRRMPEKVRLLDLGCGYHAPLMQSVADRISRAVCVDVSVSPGVKALPYCRVLEKPIQQALKELKGPFDFILFNSVLEHLDDPQATLQACYRLLAGEGVLFVNVPTWAGKYFLEKSAFVFKLSTASEIDDHKMYYNKRDLWPLLVEAGFKPSRLTLRYDKFGLNLYAICRKPLSA
jgi:2-polyprenyl-3-methyl-5-hydroxy-6-metoxy-1,4-benzoquinol methylase